MGWRNSMELIFMLDFGEIIAEIPVLSNQEILNKIVLPI